MPRRNRGGFIKSLPHSGLGKCKKEAF